MARRTIKSKFNFWLLVALNSLFYLDSCSSGARITASRSKPLKAPTAEETPSSETTGGASKSPVIRQLLLTGMISADGATTELSNGNIVFSHSSATVNGVSGAGVVQLYNGETGVLISTLYGSTADDYIGLGVTALTNGNFVVTSDYWDDANGGHANAGAATFCSGTVGCNGPVTSGNSLVGASTDHRVGRGTIALNNGNYVVSSPDWDNGSTVNVGLVKWCSGTAGCTGVVNTSNSLVGSSTNDKIGSGNVYALSDGSYVISSPLWNNGAIVDGGAVTHCPGVNGCVGVVSSTNSLVGSSTNDQISSNGISEISNSGYVIISPSWDNGVNGDAGAATWCSSSAPCSGSITLTNSLIGGPGESLANGGIYVLPNNHYVIASYFHNNGRGAVTWCSDATGCIGSAINSTNSLVGASTGDNVGIAGVSVLSNGDYVVRSPLWQNGANANAGAVTRCSGSTGCTGIVSSANSLVGSAANHEVGSSFVELANGGIVVISPNWDNGATLNVGAVTYCPSGAGCSGFVSSSNSLIGATANDQVGNQWITALANGSFVVSSSLWDNGSAFDAGAATRCPSTTGCAGMVVSSANSLVGTTTNDRVGTYGVALSEGAYVIGSPYWDNGILVDAGAVTWCSGGAGCVGAITSDNSLIGSKASDQVGRDSLTALSNGNYVVASSHWDNGSISDAGAVSWCSGGSGCTGAISSSNSIIGSSANDRVGISPITILNNDNFVIVSPLWDLGGAVDAGAVTWCTGTSGCAGTISDVNSLVGTSSMDQIGSGGVDSLTNGYYVVKSPLYGNPDTQHVKLILGTELVSGSL